MASCPAKAAALAEARAERPTGLEGELLGRRELGLRADPEYVRDLQDRYAAGQFPHGSAPVGRGGERDWSTSWGVLMTAEEEDGLWNREHALRPLIDAATAYLAGLPSRQVGGVWLALGENGIVVSLTAAADVRAVLTDLRALAGPGQSVRAVQVRWSTVELRVIEHKALARIGKVGNHHAIDVTSGVVSIMVPDGVRAVAQAVAEVVDPCAVHVSRGQFVYTPLRRQPRRG